MGGVHVSFELGEYRERVRKTKDQMAALGIEVLLITNPSNMNYLSGYDGWSFYVHQMLVIIHDEDQPKWIGRGLDENGAKITTWLNHENIVPYPDDYVQSNTKHPMDFVADFLEQIGQGHRSVGVEMENYYFTAKCYEQLKKGLPNAKFHDASLLVNWVRIVKSHKEIEYMRRASLLVEKAMMDGIELINEGVRQCDVAAKILHTQITGTGEFGGDYPAIMPLLPSGDNTSTPHLTWTDERYKQGDPVILEIAGCYKRYHSPLARTVNIGQPSEKRQALSDVVVEGLNACLDMIKPGIACEEIEETWRKTIQKYGFIKDSRLGYPVGLSYPPDWGEHTASFRKGDKTILLPNMTFHLLPGMWLEEIGFVTSETLRVTESGCETLSNVPRELFIKN